MNLTVNKIKHAKPRTKEYMLWGGDGFYVIVAPNGGKYFRYGYQFNGKEQQISVGVFPRVSLMQARDAKNEAKELLLRGINPAVVRRAKKLGQMAPGCVSFELIARSYFNDMVPTWSEGYSGRLIRRFEKDIFPLIGSLDVREISRQQMLEALKGIERRGARYSAHRLCSTSDAIFARAIAAGQCERNVASDVRAALAPVKSGHFAAIIEPSEFGRLLRAIDGYHGTRIVEAALKLNPLVFTRPGELRRAKWNEIDLDGAEWRFTLSKTPRDAEPRMHIVPLASQAVVILRELRPFTGKGTYVFPHPQKANRAMSENAILTALRNMGVPKEEMCGHGFRAAARTMLDEQLHERPDIIEHQLGHVVRDPQGRAYNRTTFLPERHAMMQRWADFCDSLKAAGTSL